MCKNIITDVIRLCNDSMTLKTTCKYVNMNANIIQCITVHVGVYTKHCMLILQK